MLKGTGVSGGIGIGNILIAEECSIEYKPFKVTDIAEEKQRFREALSKYCEKTNLRIEELKKTVGDKDAEILEGHISIVNDPFLLGEVEKLISSGQCAEAAFDSMCEMFIQLFSSSDDDVISQRADDVKDVKTGVLSMLLGVDELSLASAPKGTVICAKEITPSMIAGLNKENISGIITETGGAASHSAILVRLLEIPAVMGVQDILSSVRNGQKVIVDSEKGEIILSPDPVQIEQYSEKCEILKAEHRELEKYRHKVTASADGTEYGLFCNIGKPDDALRVLEADGEGVGLFRTEFMFMDKTTLPSEEEQFFEYKKAAMIMKGKPIIIRTLDIGGDKEIPYLGMKKEDNPFMGFRAIRYCLGNRELFRTQLRAILRASAFGNISIMFPLITCVEEVREGRAIVEELKSELKAEGKDFDNDIKVGIMTETAAAGAIADLLAKEADFFSIGTNDLTGYTMAADRSNSRVAYLYSAFQPGVLRMIRAIITAARDNNIPVGMCGEAAADPMMIPLLISFGLTEFSVTAPSVLRVRKTISQWTKEAADVVAEKVMSMTSCREIEEYLKTV